MPYQSLGRFGGYARLRQKPATKDAEGVDDDNDDDNQDKTQTSSPRCLDSLTTSASRHGLAPALRRRGLVVRSLLAFLVFFSPLFFRYLWLYPSYRSKEERDARNTRFPSVDERVKLYTSSWYNPPCDKDGKVSYEFLGDETLRVTELASSATRERRIFDIKSEVESDLMFYYRYMSLAPCALRPLLPPTYCLDTVSTVGGTREKMGWENKKPPVLLQFGDSTSTNAFGSRNHSLSDGVRLPTIKKFRFALTPEQLEQITSWQCNSSPLPESLSPIVWKLNTRRHFRGLSLVPDFDRRWKDKLDKAIFRGALTGVPSQDALSIQQGGDRKGANMSSSADLQTCLSLQRCKLVYMHADSDLVDAKLTRLVGILPEQVNGVRVAEPTQNFRGLKSMGGLLRYKGIIILEGNDVSSGLKWALLSQSVVLMPIPTYTSWAMEELLEPWVHYIPLNSNLSDVEEKVQWMIDHEAEAQQISYRASLWIKDLVFHPDAEQDDASIYEEILRRYKAYF